VGNDDKIPGVVRRSSTGELLDGGPALLVKSLDELPMPEYGLYPADSDEEIFIEVGRGCPFHCSFCSTAPYWNRVHRVKTPERIVAEIRCVRELYATKRFHFTHDLFTADRSWVLQVCQELIDSQLDIKWTCSSRTDTVDDMVLALMSKAGCDSIYFGLESGSERIQREIHKYIPLERSLQIIESCQSHNIHPNVGLIIGFQSEDEQSLRDTFQAFEITLRHGANPVHIFGFCPFKGSKLYPSLHDLQCTGHFLDLPLDNDLDIQNRLTIQSNVDLYGSYFRPRNQIFDAMVHNPISGVDEFSILVNIALIPSLILSDLMGGMYGLYTIWLAWIHKYNTRRDASPFREYYGSPLQYCFFLKECIDDRLTPAHFTHSYIRYLIANFSLPTDNLFKEAPEINVIPSSYEQSRLQDHILGDHISSLPLVIGNVISRMTLKHDVKQMLKMMASDLTHEPEARECCLIWQAQQDRIRLLEIDAFLYAVIDSLFQASPQSLDAIISNSKSVPQDLRLASGLNTNRIILNAIRMGLIAISPSLGVTSNDHVHVF
jgi:hypothetical protein